MSTKHEDAARSLSREARTALLNATESGRVPDAPTEVIIELEEAGVTRGSHLTVYGEVVRFYALEQDLEGLG